MRRLGADVCFRLGAGVRVLLKHALNVCWQPEAKNANFR